MTRYDPFAYGEVHLDPNQSKGGMPVEVDNQYFAADNPAKPAPSVDSDWSLFDDDADVPAPSVPLPAVEGEIDDFGGSIFGELPPLDHASSGQVSAHLMPPQEADDGYGELGDAPQELGSEHHELDPESENLSQVAPSPNTVPNSAESGVTSARQHREVRRRRQPAATVVAPDAVSQGVAKVKKKRIPGRRRRTALTVALPILLCAGGGTVGSWFWVMQGNPVMASIIAAASIVSGLFARLFLRG
jgi:hypothetical protein